MSYKLLLAFWALTVTARAQSQSISGIVLNKADEKTPVAGALVRAVDSQGETLSYVISGEDGRFSLPLPQCADTIMVSFLGYIPFACPRPFRTAYRIMLVPKEELLKEAVVSADKVVFSGDTIRYNVNALKRKEDTVLSDFLSRVPGIEVDKKGFVKYNGQQINKLYLDGRDVLQNDYNLATRNLSIDIIKEIEVLENHQAIKMMRGILTSEQAALNIVLNEKAKMKVNWGISGGIGVTSEDSSLVGYARASAFYLGGKYSTINVGGFDNDGFALLEQEHSPYMGISSGHKQVESYLKTSRVKAPLSDPISLFNKSLEASTINHFSVNETSSVSFSLKYGRDGYNSRSMQKSVYKDTDNAGLTIDREERRQDLQQSLSAVLAYTNNGTNAFISSKTIAALEQMGGTTDVSGGRIMAQSTAGNNWNVENETTASIRNGPRILSLEFYTQISGIEESLRLDGESANQKIKSGLLYHRFSVSGISRQWRHSRFSIQPLFHIQFFNRTSGLTGKYTEPLLGDSVGKSSSRMVNGGIDCRYMYKNNNVETSFSAKADVGWCGIDGESIFLPTGEMSADFKYVAGRWDFVITQMVGLKGPDIQGFGQYPILTGYYTMCKGAEGKEALPFSRAALKMKFREPVSGWNSQLKCSLNWGRNYVQAREFLGNYILDYLSNAASPYVSTSADVMITKGLFKMNGIVSVSFNYIFTHSLMQQNEDSLPYDIHMLTPKMEGTFTITRWWKVSAAVELSASTYAVKDMIPSWKTDAHVMANQAFYITSTLTGGVEVDCYSHTAIGGNYVFPSLYLLWNNNRGVRLTIKTENLANIRYYSWRSLSPLLEETMRFKIRPLTILAGVDWRF